jgi:hypothetical protein
LQFKHEHCHVVVSELIRTEIPATEAVIVPSLAALAAPA